MNQIMKYSTLIILLFIQFSTLAQQEAPIVDPREQQPNTVILSEKDYEELVNRANNPNCPTCPKVSEVRVKDTTTRLSKKGISLRVGGGINYMYGADTDNNDSFDSDFVSWYGEGMIGYVVNYNQKGLGTVLGAFISIGNSNKAGIQKFLDDSEISETADEDENMYYQAELGAVLFETIRISTGTGYQNFKNTSGDNKEVYYYSTTTGLEFGSRYMKFSANISFLYGRDIQGTILRPTLGIIFQL